MSFVYVIERVRERNGLSDHNSDGRTVYERIGILDTFFFSTIFKFSGKEYFQVRNLNVGSGNATVCVINEWRFIANINVMLFT